jgi:hypothetical protein
VLLDFDLTLIFFTDVDKPGDMTVDESEDVEMVDSVSKTMVVASGNVERVQRVANESGEDEAEDEEIKEVVHKKRKRLYVMKTPTHHRKSQNKVQGIHL